MSQFSLGNLTLLKHLFLKTMGACHGRFAIVLASKN